MANELTFGHISGETITAGIYAPDGTERASGINVTEIGSTGIYTATSGDIQTGDLVIFNDGTDNVGFGEYHTAGVLSSDGLDSVAVTEPSGKASNFREMIVQLWRRFFGKVILSSGQLVTYKQNGVTVATTQQIDETATLQTQGEAV